MNETELSLSRINEIASRDKLVKADIEAAMLAAMNSAEPEHLLVSDWACGRIEQIIAEQEALDEVRSPVGLARLFPGLGRG